MKRDSIPEFLLQSIWKSHEDFLTDRLVLVDGTPISILEPGVFNDHRGGPDFLDARIEIDGLVLAGDIEIHTSPGEWDTHGHDDDTRYAKVILHVVLDCETDAKRLAIPTLALRDNLAFNRRELWRKLFEDLYSRAPELPCFPHNLLLTMPFKRKVVERFGDIRLDEIVKRFEGSSESGSARDQRVYEGIMDALGFSQNREPFRALATTVPIEILREIGRKFPSASLPVWEALFFGMAGLLPVPSAAFDLETNEYLIELRAEFETLQLATNLVPELAEGDWAHFRIRPLNTPYRRLALAALLAYAYFTKEEIEVLIQDGPIVEVGMSPYWERHTSFGNALESQQSLLGEERLEAILLNVLIPARISALDSLADRGIQRSHAAEKAKELRREWGDARTKSSANYLKVVEAELLESERVICVRSEQGTLFLKRNFCDRGRCSECPIGERLMAKGWKPLV